MARQVADLRAALVATAGSSWRAPWTVLAPLRGPEPARPIRVAVVTDPARYGTATQVRDSIRAAADALADHQAGGAGAGGLAAVPGRCPRW